MSVRPVKLHHLAAYGLTDILGAGAMAVIGGWILFFYTSFCGLTAVEATSIFAIARLFDAIASPIIGHLSDGMAKSALGKRFGRRRVFLLFCLPLLPAFTLMWVSGQNYWYYLLTYVFFEVVYTAVLIPYETLAAEMTDDFKTRARFAGARILVGQMAAIAAGILPAWIITTLGKESADTFLYLGIIFSALFVLAVGTTWWFSWERDPATLTERPIAAQASQSIVTRIYSALLSTLRVRAFRLHLGMYLGGYTAMDVFTAVFTYFVVFSLSGSVSIAASMMALLGVAQLISVAAFIPLLVQLSPGKAYRIAAALFAAGIVCIGLAATLLPAPKDSLWLIYGCVFLCGLGRGGLVYIPWSTYNYIADVDEIMTGQRREGIFAGVMTMVRKTVQAGAVMAVGVILDMGGFVSGATSQPPGAVNTIIFILMVPPLILLMLGCVASAKFLLSRQTHDILMNEIACFKRTGKGSGSAASQLVVEDLTGYPFHRMWPHAEPHVVQPAKPAEPAPTQ
jgi:oligogalacturonide transporter